MKNLKIWLLLVFLTGAKSGIGQNPISPPGIYIADPSAHQWADGKMYIYGSRDESPNYYCSGSYHVLYSPDLLKWDLTANTFASFGKTDQVNYSDNFLYAPDCQYKNGLYYLYYCLSTNKNTAGVATSTMPNGPFLKGVDINLKGINEIDPCVFIDDDGQGYYIWGQFNAKIAKLKPNMLEIDTNTIIQNLLNEKEHFFHEGGYMVKHNQTYYFVYAHMGRAGKPTCLGYATSKLPTGPFTYKGVIIDNSYCDPNNWNNHGSIAKFNNKWYVFYHRATHGSQTMRKACIEPITFNDDETINEVEMTTQGAGSALKASQIIDAERACLLYGNVRVQLLTTNNEQLTGINNGDAVAYKYIDFENGQNTFTAKLAPGAKKATIEIVLDNSWNAEIATLDIPANKSNNKWGTYSCKIKTTKGVHAVWLRFKGTGQNLLSLDNFVFSKQ